MRDFKATELKHRISSGWAAFMSNNAELCGKRYAFKHRARLLEAVVTPCVTYAASIWTLTKDMERDLWSVRRKMLRMMIRTSRRRAAANHLEDEANKSLGEGSVDTEPGLEPWVDWIWRATHKAEQLVNEVCLDDWVVIHRKRKWQFARKTATKADDRWSKRLLSRKPSGSRNPGRPVKRWSDDIIALAGEMWSEHAAAESLWGILEYAFVNRDNVSENL